LRKIFGSLAAFAAKSEGWHEAFDYGDLFQAQTMLLRLGEVVLITTFNDACGALQGTMPRLEKISGPLAELQAREVMVDFAFMNLSLKERPRFQTDIDMDNQILTEKAVVPAQFELGNLDYRLRGGLMRSAFGNSLSWIQILGKTNEEVQQMIDDGRFTLLFDNGGKFIKNSFTPLSSSND
jgi:hypothetical protein